MCFFFYVSRHFFFTKPTRVRGKKTKCPKKKKHWLSVPDYLTDKWHTELGPNFVYLLPNNDRVKAGPPPLEAILVIFGRRALIFFLFESSWKKMKNDTTFLRMRSGDHLGDAKMSKKGTSLRRI